jgi:hypothetical protein
VRKAFISYARVNRAHVDELVEHLGVLGWQVWIDSSLRGGQHWWDEILRQITDCDVFVPIISIDALNSAACQREFDWAEALDKPVLPVAVEPLPRAIPRRLSLRQIIDYSDAARAEHAALRLAGALSAVPSAPSLPEPLPPRCPISPIWSNSCPDSTPSISSSSVGSYIRWSLHFIRSIRRNDKAGSTSWSFSAVVRISTPTCIDS